MSLKKVSQAIDILDNFICLLWWLQKLRSVPATVTVIFTSNSPFWSPWWAIKIANIRHVEMHFPPKCFLLLCKISTWTAQTLSWADLLKNLSCHQYNTIVQNSNRKTVKPQAQIRTKTETNSNVHNQLDDKITKQSKVPWVKELSFSFVFLLTFNLPPLLHIDVGEETLVNRRLDSYRNLSRNIISIPCFHYDWSLSVCGLQVWLLYSSQIKCLF